MGTNDMGQMREALDEADTILSVIGYSEGTPIRRRIREVLSKPVRNCDVGTAEEQIERFDAECLAIRKRNTVESCAGCPCSIGGEGTEDCQLRWAQMPYEGEVEGKEG